jgi:hypothetical protein
MNRDILDPRFARDNGLADPEVLAALAAHEEDGDFEPLALLLPTARFFVPLLAVPVEPGAQDEQDEQDEHDCGHDHEGDHGHGHGHGQAKGSEMTVLTLRLTDGQVAVPIFTSVPALTEWHAEARPMPIDGRSAGRSALDAEVDMLLIDLSGPVTVAVAGEDLVTLAGGIEAPGLHEDPEIAAALVEHLRSRPAFRAALLSPAEDEDSDVRLTLVMRDDEVDVDAAVAGLSEALAQDPVLAERLELGLELALLPSDTELPAERLY